MNGPTDSREITPVDDGPGEGDVAVDAALGDLVRCAYHDRWLRARLQIVEDHIRDLRCERRDAEMKARSSDVPDR